MSRGLLCPGLVQPERRLPEMSFKCHMRKRRPAHFPSDKSHRYPNYVLYLCVCVCVCVHTPHTHSYKGHGYPMNECMCSCPRSMCIHEVAPRHTYARHTYLRVCILIVHTHTHTHTHTYIHMNTHTHMNARAHAHARTHTQARSSSLASRKRAARTLSGRRWRICSAWMSRKLSFQSKPDGGNDEQQHARLSLRSLETQRRPRSLLRI